VLGTCPVCFLKNTSLAKNETNQTYIRPKTESMAEDSSGEIYGIITMVIPMAISMGKKPTHGNSHKPLRG